MQNIAINRQNTKRMDIYYKVLLIGPRRVGKTQILKRICHEEFNENYSPSFGLDFRIQKYYSDNLVIQIIELADKSYSSHDIVKEYIIEADCFICIYDITNINSVRELIDLVKNYEQYIPQDNKNQCWYFVGNKSDDKNRECTNRPENLFSYVPYNNIGFIEISAKENKFIDDMFRNVIMRINDMHKAKNEKRKEFRYSKKNNRYINNTMKENNMNSTKRLNETGKDNFKKNDFNNNDKKDKTNDEIIKDKKGCVIY